MQKGNVLVPMGRSGQFGRRSGEVLYIFDCQKKIGKIEASIQCYDRIPLEGSVDYVDPYTRVVKIE